jgi:ubiquinone/menaquinone biosynthesis C-methylase UbiE
MVENGSIFQWPYGLVPLSRHETHDKVIEMIGREPRGKILDIPTGTGVLADRLRKMGFEVCCCDINPDYFSIPGMKVDIGDMNQRLPYENHSFDYLVCLDGIEHTENPSNAIREFSRVLKKGGKFFLSLPNILNIERRLRFLFMGTFSKIPTHETIRDIWKGDLSMAHLSPLSYPLLKFMMEHYGFRILLIEKDRKKNRMIWLKPLVWIIRCYGLFISGRKRELYRIEETLHEKIIMGGNTLIIMGDKTI